MIRRIFLLTTLFSGACFAAESHLQGIYGVHTGYVGEAIELKDGQFRYWYSTDKVYAGMPQYPFKGSYAVDKDLLTLHHPELEKRKWRCAVIDGKRLLLPIEKSGFELNLLQFHRKDSDSPWDGTPNFEMVEKLILEDLPASERKGRPNKSLKPTAPRQP